MWGSLAVALQLGVSDWPTAVTTFVVALGGVCAVALAAVLGVLVMARLLGPR